MAGFLTDYIGVSVKDIADLYVGINQSKINAGLQNQRNTIDQLLAQSELTRQQAKLAESLNVDPQKKASTDNGLMGLTSSKLFGFALLAGGAFLVYKLVK